MARNDIYYGCSNCGQAVNANGTWSPERMIELRLCYECYRWLELAERDQANLWVINGQLFEFHPCKHQNLADDDRLGKLWYILAEDSLFISDTLFNYGEIPQRFLPLFKNHGRFLKRYEYKSIYKRRDYRCNRKGCWSRANCWWYSGEMDCNVIPPRKKPNPENCPAFLLSIKPKK